MASKKSDKKTPKKSDKKTPKKAAKKDPPLRVNTSFEDLLNMAVNNPPKKKKK